MVIAVAGLYALARQAIRRRLREMALRRIHGAGKGTILALMLKQMSVPAVGGLMVGLGLSAYFARDHLLQYAERISLSSQMFMGVALVVMLILGGVVASHVMRTLRIHPSEVLRSE